MEDLLINDPSFEVYSNSDGAKILARNRVLMDYPNEKNSFDVFMGFTDANNDGKDDVTGKTKEEEEKDKNKVFTQQNIETGAKLLTSGIQTGQAVTGAVKSFQTEQKKAIKEKCGRKPTLKKNRATYDACVKEYLDSISGGGDTGTETGGKKSAEITEPKKNNNKNLIIIGIVVVALIGGVIYLKKTGKI